MKALARALVCAVLAVHGWLAAAAEVPELRIPKGAGGIAFLPLLVMEKQKSIEKYAAELGHAGLKVASLKNRANSWKDLFFPDVHDLPGS